MQSLNLFYFQYKKDVNYKTQGLIYLKELKKLKTLEITYNGLKDEDLMTIGELIDLENLSLRHCDKLTDVGLTYLAELKNLKTLNLERWNNFSNEGLIKLKVSLKRLER